MSNFLKIFMIALIWIGLTISACPVLAQSNGETAFLFGYFPIDGQKEKFNEGYRKHIEWHREHNDPLVWYGWYVSFGERVGLFIDGTFGTSAKALAVSTDAAADAANFAQTTAPYGEQAFRRAYVLRRDLSTGTPLENREPPPLMHVYFYELQPGMASTFEHVLQTLQSAQDSASEASEHTWYQLVGGGTHPAYMLMVPRDVWGDFGNSHEALASSILRNFDSDEADDLLSALTEAVESVRSEQWSYRSDLSYFPDK